MANINFKELVERSPAGVFFADAFGQYVFTNTAWQVIFGMSLKKSLGKGWMTTLHVEDRDRIVDGWERAVMEQREFAMEFCTCPGDGKVRYVLAKARPLTEKNQTKGFLGSVEDITERHALQNIMFERERSHSRLLSNLSGMAYRCIGGADREMIYVSNGCQELTGFHSSDFVSLNTRLFNSIIHPEDKGLVCQGIQKHLSNKTPYRYEYRILDRDYTVKWVWDQGEGIFDKKNKLSYIEGLITDITHQKKIENALRDERNLLSTIINSSTDFIFAKDKNLKTFLCNEAFASALGCAPEMLYGKNDIENGWPEELVKGDIENGVRGYEHDDLDALRGEVVHNNHDIAYVGGELRIFDTVKLPIRDSSNEIIGMLGVARDITEASMAAEKIWYQANYDALTGLPNRNMFTDRMKHQIQYCEREEKSFALLFVDLDFFKEVNDSLGHEFGDLLLAEVARRISKCVRGSDTVSRFAGDEFVLLLPNLRHSTDVERISSVILKGLKEPFILKNETAIVSASIGVAIYPDDSRNMAELLKFADQAMYQAKRSGRRRCCFFKPCLQKAADLHRKLISDLRLGIENNQLELYFQPIIDLNSQRVTKAEALVRWNHPELGVLLPKDFICLAEEMGYISEMGNWVFTQAALQVKKWRENISKDFQISVNKSPAQFHDEKSQKTLNWKSYLDHCHLSGSSVAVEITEGMLLNESEFVANKLLFFRNAGIQVALDDFGTGYSALSYLKKFVIDYIKIDRSFVMNIDRNENDLLLFEAVIAMAHKLGLKVVAEGVESKAQFDIVQNFGCDYAQGFYFAKPMPAEEFEKFMTDFGQEFVA